MVALPNLNGVQPSYGGGEGGLPDGKYKTVLVSAEKKDKHDQMGNLTSSYLELMHQVVDGPLTGQKQPDRLTLLHSSQEVVRISSQQLAAYTHVLGRVGATDTSQLLNLPMFIEVGRQLDKTTKQPLAYGEVKRIFDVNGNEPGKAAQNQAGQQPQGGGFQQQPNGPPAGGVTTDGGGWQGQGGQQGGQQPQGGFQQQPQGGQQGGGFQQPQPGADGANWGGPAGGAQQPQGGGFQQGQQPQQQPQGGGWSQGQGGGGGGPQWGQ